MKLYDAFSLYLKYFSLSICYKINQAFTLSVGVVLIQASHCGKVFVILHLNGSPKSIQQWLPLIDYFLSRFSSHNFIIETSNANNGFHLTLDCHWIFSDHWIFLCGLESISFVCNRECFTRNTYTFLTKDWNNSYSNSIHYERCKDYDAISKIFSSQRHLYFSLIYPKHCCNNFTFFLIKAICSINYSAISFHFKIGTNVDDL